MHLLHLLATATPNPDPTLRPGLDPNQVTPGPWGFFITFALAVVVFLLVRDMTRRIRRVRYREQVGEARSPEAGAPDGGREPSAEDAGAAKPADGAPGRPGEAPQAGPGRHGPGN